MAVYLASARESMDFGCTTRSKSRYGIRISSVCVPALNAISSFSANDHNDYFGNTLGTCSACSVGAGSLAVDPLYLDSSIDDFRLQPGSALIDAGIDTGNDVNGPQPGNGLFNGSNPDIGAHESN